MILGCPGGSNVITRVFIRGGRRVRVRETSRCCPAALRREEGAMSPGRPLGKLDRKWILCFWKEPALLTP